MSDAKPKILFVDDEKMLLELYSIKFAKNGFDVVVCSSAEQALTLLAQGYAPDVIMFDITMPEMGGYEFLESTRSIPHVRHALKVALTNEGQDAEKARTIELGADAHIVKAMRTPAELVEDVRALLGKRHRFF